MDDLNVTWPVEDEAALLRTIRATYEILVAITRQTDQMAEHLQDVEQYRLSVELETLQGLLEFLTEKYLARTQYFELEKNRN